MTLDELKALAQLSPSQVNGCAVSWGMSGDARVEVRVTYRPLITRIQVFSTSEWDAMTQPEVEAIVNEHITTVRDDTTAALAQMNRGPFHATNPKVAAEAPKPARAKSQRGSKSRRVGRAKA